MYKEKIYKTNELGIITKRFANGDVYEGHLKVIIKMNNKIEKVFYF